VVALAICIAAPASWCCQYDKYVGTSMSAWIQLNEVPNNMELCGMLLIGLALVLISYFSIKRHVPIDPAMAQD
jgi:hypothetical protein